jgi:hypothetical protein
VNEITPIITKDRAPVDRGDGLTNVAAEAALIGALLISAALVVQVAERVQPRDFSDPVLGRLAAAIYARSAAGKAVNAILLWPDVQADEGLLALGGKKFLAQLTSSGEGLVDTLDFADQIRELAHRRRRQDAHLAAAEAYGDTDIPLSDIPLPSDQDDLLASGASLPFFWFDEAEPNLDANDFVEGLLTSTAMSVVYGPSNCGKTFFVIDLAAHVAWGRDWRGRAVDRGAVVYLSLEGSQGIRNRLSAFRQHHGLAGEQLPFVVMPKPVNLLDDAANVHAVIQLVRHVAQVTGLPVRLVVIDTLSRAMAGGNENSAEDMTAIVENCDRIRHATGAHVCIVHHSGKDEAKGARGHSSLRAATDTEIEIRRDPELTISRVRVAKQRDLEPLEPFAFSLQKVAVGINTRGKDVTSCVVVEAEQSVALARDPDKLSPKEAEALAALDDCISAAGIDVPANGGGDGPGVSAASWKRALQARRTIDPDADHVARSQFSRLRKALETKNRIGVGGDYVWRL